MCRSIYAYMNADFILILEAAATDEFSAGADLGGGCRGCAPPPPPPR